MRQAVYDAGALGAADRSERRIWADHRVRLEAGLRPAVPAPVVAQVSRSQAQVQLRRFLRGCRVHDLTEADAHRIGRLLGESSTSDVVDAAVARLAVDIDADVVTSDRADLLRLLDALDADIEVIEP